MSEALFIWLAAAVLIVAAGIVAYRRFPFHLIYRSKIGCENMLYAVGEPLAVIAPDYTVRRANKAYMDLVSGSFPGSIGRKCYELLRGLDRPCEQCRMESVIAHRKPEVVERMPHPSGAGSLRLSFSPYLQDEADRKLSIIEHLRDITQIERLKGELEANNRILADAMVKLKAAQHSVREDLRLARKVQEGILPKNPPDFQGLSIALSYLPASEVGGDLYDFLPFSENELGVFVGDASGHGISASMIGMIAKMSLFSHSKGCRTPAQLVSAINRDLFVNIQTSHYLTCFLGIFDQAGRTLRYCRAGHPMPVVIRRDGSVCTLDTPGTFVGIIEDAVFEEATYEYQPGDRFFLFTDGMYEVRKGEERSFGYDRFVELLCSLNDLGAGQVIPEIKNRLAGFNFDDDCTILVVEVGDENGAPRLKPA